MQHLFADQPTLEQKYWDEHEFSTQNLETTNIKTMPWPMEPPFKNKNRTHISLNRGEDGYYTQPFLRQTPLYDDPYQHQRPIVDVRHQLHSPLKDLYEIHTKNIAHETVIESTALEDDILYSCKVLAQLQGQYETETSIGHMKVTVILREGNYARVHLVSNDGKVLTDKFIYHELFWFKLCSADGKVEGVFREGSNMKHSVKWWKTDDESYTIWRRKGDVTFILIPVDSSTCSNSITSLCTVSTTPPSAHPIDSLTLGSDENPMHIRPKRVRRRRTAFLNDSSGGSSSTSCLHENSSFNIVSASSFLMDQNNEEVFELIKAQCSKNEVLFEKVVEWCIANNPASRISKDETRCLSEGRL